MMPVGEVVNLRPFMKNKLEQIMAWEPLSAVLNREMTGMNMEMDISVLNQMKNAVSGMLKGYM
jgi:hypothetical protein